MQYLVLLTFVLLTITELVKCPQNDPSVSCPTENTEVCGFTSDQQQFGTFENSCFACRSSSVSYYQANACQQTTNYTTYDNSTSLSTSVDYQCSTTRPTSCDDNVNTVCASYKCDNKTCEKEFQNECQACLDSTTLSYKKNLCQVSYQPLMTLAFIIQLLF